MHTLFGITVALSLYGVMWAVFDRFGIPSWAFLPGGLLCGVLAGHITPDRS